MRHRGDIFDDGHFESGEDQSPDSGFTTGTGSFDADFNFLHTVKLGFFGGVAGDHLSSISGALTGAFETILTAGRPALRYEGS